MSPQQHAASRTARLRRIYPAGTPRETVQAKWKESKPELSETRPAAGWKAHRNLYTAKKLGDMEASTGKRIESFELYSGPDGLYSMCYCWYFYDASGKVVDVQWQYKSD